LDNNGNVLAFEFGVFEEDRIKLFLSNVKYISDNGLVFITNDSEIISYDWSTETFHIFGDLP